MGKRTVPPCGCLPNALGKRNCPGPQNMTTVTDVGWVPRQSLHFLIPAAWIMARRVDPQSWVDSRSLLASSLGETACRILIGEQSKQTGSCAVGAAKRWECSEVWMHIPAPTTWNRWSCPAPSNRDLSVLASGWFLTAAASWLFNSFFKANAAFPSRCGP